jgi:hypothetical protein
LREGKFAFVEACKQNKNEMLGTICVWNRIPKR